MGTLTDPLCKARKRIIDHDLDWDDEHLCANGSITQATHNIADFYISEIDYDEDLREELFSKNAADLENDLKTEFSYLKDEFENEEDHKEHLEFVYDIGENGYANEQEFLNDLDWDYVHKMTVGMGWKERSSNYSNKAIEAIKSTYDLKSLKEIDIHKCESGAAHQHVYYNQTLPFFETYKKEILNYFNECLGKKLAKEYLNTLNKKNDLDKGDGYQNDVVWQFVEMIASDTLKNEEKE